MTKMHAVLMATLMALGLGACGGGGGSAGGPGGVPVVPPGALIPQLAIVATLTSWQHKDLYITDLQGSAMTRVPINFSDPYGNVDRDPTWSPDGAQLAFVVKGNDRWLGLTPADGSTVTRVTTWADSYRYVWSPDGTKLAISNGVYSIYDPATSQMQQVSVTPPVGKHLDWFKWSPDSTRIAYSLAKGLVGGPCDVYTVKADGTDSVKVATSITTNDILRYAWSPDGTRLSILAAADTSGVNRQLYVVNADGTNSTLLTTGTLEDLQWSPDGASIGLLRDPANGFVEALWVVNVATAAAVRVSNLGEPNAQEWLWSADSSRLVYTTFSGVYSAKADGSFNAKINAPWTPDQPIGLRLSPDGTRIGYIDTVSGVSGATFMGPDGSAPVGVNNVIAGNMGYPTWNSTSTGMMYDVTSGGIRRICFSTVGGTAAQVSGAMVAGGTVSESQLYKDGSHIVYIADAVSVGNRGIYCAATDGSGLLTIFPAGFQQSATDFAVRP